MTNFCGTCTLCCKLMGVGGTPKGDTESFRKLQGVWCKHCTIGKGCNIYEKRPEECSAFECVWLSGKKEFAAGKIDTDPPDEMKPENCGVVIAGSTDERVIGVFTDKHKADAWRTNKTVYHWLCGMAIAGFRIVISADCGTVKTVLIYDKNRGFIMSRRRFTEPDEKGMQWHIPGSEGTVTTK